MLHNIQRSQQFATLRRRRRNNYNDIIINGLCSPDPTNSEYYIIETTKDESWRKLSEKFYEIIEKNESPLCAAYKNLLQSEKSKFFGEETEPFRNILHWMIWEFSRSKLFTRAASRQVTNMVIIMFQTLVAEHWFKEELIDQYKKYLVPTEKILRSYDSKLPKLTINKKKINMNIKNIGFTDDDLVSASTKKNN